MAPRAVLVSLLLILSPIAAGPAAGQQILLVSPALPTSADQITVVLSVVDCAFRVTTAVQGNTITLSPDLSEPCPPLVPPDPGVATRPTFGPLPAGSYTILVVANGQTTDKRTLYVQQPTTQLSLQKARFSASVSWSLADGQDVNAAQAVQDSDSSGHFWFFDKENSDVTIKMIGGLDAFYWVFISSATNVAFTVTIVDTWLCPESTSCVTRTYQNPAGTNQNFFDFTSFTYN